MLCFVKRRGFIDSNWSLVGLVNVDVQNEAEELLQPTWIRVCLFTVRKLPGRKQVVETHYLTVTPSPPQRTSAHL